MHLCFSVTTFNQVLYFIRSVWFIFFSETFGTSLPLFSFFFLTLRPLFQLCVRYRSTSTPQFRYAFPLLTAPLRHFWVNLVSYSGSNSPNPFVPCFCRRDWRPSFPNSWPDFPAFFRPICCAFVSTFSLVRRVCCSPMPHSFTICAPRPS